jgi:hypothetical protein
MVSNKPTEYRANSVGTAFSKLMTYINLAQKTEEAAQNLENITSEKETTLTDVADRDTDGPAS